MGRKKLTETVPANEADAITTETIDRRAISPGMRDRVLADFDLYLDDPDRPLVRYAQTKQNLEAGRLMNVSVSKMYEDGGHKVRVLQHLAARGAFVRFPETVEGVLESCEQLLDFCIENKVPPTLGLFALWNGVSVQRVNQIERDSNDPRSLVVSFCKEIVRNVMEQAALDNTVNPLLYFHQQKSQYGFVENQTVTVKHEDNSRDMSDDEYRQRVILLTQREDGTYSADQD